MAHALQGALTAAARRVSQFGQKLTVTGKASSLESRRSMCSHINHGYPRSMLKEHYPDWRYGPPASADAIAEAEAKLGVPFPNELRVLYLEADGVRENMGDAAYLLPLAVEESLVSLTKSLWAEWEGFRPEFDLKPFVFFGSSIGGDLWGINWQRPSQVIAFHHHMEGAYEAAGASILDVYRGDFARYGQL